MHNIRLADPLDPHTINVKKLSSINKKSIQDHKDLAEAEFYGGLYYEPSIGPYLPTMMLRKALIEGAKVRKLGPKFEIDIEVEDPIEVDGYALDYKGPRVDTALWNNTKPVFYKRAVVSVGMNSSIVRTRPMFPSGWSCTFKITSAEDAVTDKEIQPT